MLPVIDYDRLFKPYDALITVSGVVGWLQKEADKQTIPSQVMEVAVAETFMEIANGKKFSTKGCDCGCELKNPHSALIHYMRQKMIDLNAETMGIYTEALSKNLERAIELHVALRWRLWRWLGRG